jgi:glycosyltransferase involved in cell wall biosynthesis
MFFMTGTPLVSVVIPAYNVVNYVCDAVESVQRQTYSNLQIIIVDDGSTDGTAEHLDRLQANDQRIQVINRGHQGLVPALNIGLDAATGTYIARMDADDICYPTRIEKQVALHEAHPDLSLSGTHVDYLVARNRLLRVNQDDYSSVELKKHTVFNVFYAHPTIMIPRRVLEEKKIRYNPDYPGAEDFELYRHLAPDHHFAFIREPLVVFRTNHSSVQSKYPLICSSSSQKIAAENFQTLGVDIDLEGVRQLMASDRQFAEHDLPALSHLLRAGKKALELLSCDSGAAQRGFQAFLSNLFEGLAHKGDLKLLSEAFAKENLLGDLLPRSRTLITLAKLFPADTALRLRQGAIAANQIRRSTRFVIPSGDSSTSVHA